VDQDHPVANATVVAVPEERYRQLPDRFGIGATDQHGQFTIRGMAPGSYTFYAWQDMEEGVWRDPDTNQVQFLGCGLRRNCFMVLADFMVFDAHFLALSTFTPAGPDPVRKGLGPYLRQHFLDKTFQGLYQVNAFDLALLIPYFIVLVILAAYGGHRYWMVYLYYKHKKNKTTEPPAHFDELPRVTVQLPIYNEQYVVDRLLDAVCRLDYPKDKLDIQLLDDSTDETVRLRASWWSATPPWDIPSSTSTAQSRGLQGWRAGKA
jgi:hypothetical protein